GGDPARPRVPRPREDDRLSLEQHLALVGYVHAGEDLDQRRLAGAVVSEHAGDLAGVHSQADVLERVDAPEVLRDRPHFERRLAVVRLHVLALRRGFSASRKVILLSVTGSSMSTARFA